ncbi:MAG TPA: PilZ domain-containing protein [Terriglobia bacterium]|nr:PilZ domain-containing protein [Terriglobia bacterium]
MPTESPSERRRKSRLAHKVRIMLSGHDAEGFKFAEETETVTVSKNGASVRTSYLFALGQELSVRTKDRDRVGQFQVVWLGKAGTPSEGKIGLEWLESQRFWGVEFAPEDWEND